MSIEEKTMSITDDTNIIRFEPIRKNRKEEVCPEQPQFTPEDSFYYTLDLLMEDFGKKHLLEQCILCNPMRVYGEHRDEVIFRLLVALFYRFFPSLDDYLADARKNLMEGLIIRKNGKIYPSLQEKFSDLLQEQMKGDLRDFGREIQKHLLKHAQVEISPEKIEEVLARVMGVLQEQWMEIGR